MYGRRRRGYTKVNGTLHLAEHMSGTWRLRLGSKLHVHGSLAGMDVDRARA